MKKKIPYGITALLLGISTISDAAPSMKSSNPEQALESTSLNGAHSPPLTSTLEDHFIAEYKRLNASCN